MADLTGQNIQDTYQKVVQVDNNQLQDGTGSNLPISFDGNNVIVSGSITAHEYIVSSSVTNITIATKSGSTAFGDTLDDVHTFTGKSLRFKSDENTTQRMSVNIVHSTSSTGVSSTGGRLDFTTGDYSLLNGGPNHSVRIRTNAIDEYNHPIPDRSYGMDINGDLYVDNISNTGGKITAKGTISGSGLLTSFVSASSHITSQGNISASGLISTPYQISAGGQIHGGLLKTDGYLVGDTSQPTELFVAGKVTVATTISADGNISSSGNVYAVDYFDNGTNINTLYDLTPTGTYSSSLQTLTNITASGNISSSSQITSERLVVKNVLNDEIASFTSINGTLQLNVNTNGVQLGKVTNHITASGNISSSGYVYSANEDTIQFNFQTDATATTWHGPNRFGLTEYYWNKDYGDDDGVKQISLEGADKRFVQSGWHVPYNCQITGWTLLATGNKNNAPYTFTGSLLTGDPVSASIALHSDTSNDVGQILNLTEMHQSASLPTSLNDRYGIRYIDAKSAMSYSLEAGQHVYPRIKHTTLDGAATPKAQIQGNWTIYYRRVK